MKAFNRLIFLLLIVFLLPSCGLIHEKRLAGHMKRGKEYMAAKKYREAEIEFKNVIKLDKSNAEGHYNIAVLYMKMGGREHLGLAYRELLQTVELAPGILDAQVRLGEFDLRGHRPGNARKRAEAVLKKAPGNIDGQIILAKAYMAEKKFKKSLEILKKTIKKNPGSVKAYLTLGAVQSAAGDLISAEKTYKKAISIEPSDSEARIAMANLFMSTKRYDDAEREMKKGIEKKSGNIRLRNMLAGFYLRMNRRGDAEAVLESVIRVAPEKPGPYLSLSNFYLRTAAPLKAEEVLKRGMESVRNPDVLRMFLAELLLNRKNNDDAAKVIDKILASNEEDPMGLSLRGRLMLSRGETEKAVEDLKVSIEGFPDMPSSHYFLGAAYRIQKKFALAKSEYSRALELAPGMARARLDLAAVYFATGDYSLADEENTIFLKKNPEHPTSNLLAGDIKLRERKPAEAMAFFKRTIKYAPENPLGYARLGTAYQMMGRRDKALRYYDRALSINPGLIDVLAIEALMEISAKRPRMALKRVRTHLKKFPKDPELYYLLGRVYIAVKEMGKAEEALKKAIEIKEGLVGPYVTLGAVYASRGSFDSAITKYKKALEIKPGYLLAYMMLGILYERKDEMDKAVESYKKALEIKPDFAPAANNLAWIYTENGGNIDVALGLAETASSKNPGDPNISDTLGWIYYKKKAYLKAVSYLRESAEKLSRNPTVHYHLGMAYYKRGNRKLAMKELKSSLRLNPDFPGSDEAKKALKELSQKNNPR